MLKKKDEGDYIARLVVGLLFPLCGFTQIPKPLSSSTFPMGKQQIPYCNIQIPDNQLKKLCLLHLLLESNC